MQRFAVIGLGSFGRRLARALTAAEAEVIAIDRRARPVEQIRDDVALAVCLDSTDEEALKAQSIHEVDVAIVGIGDDFESAALTVAGLKELGVKHIIARAETDVQARILERVGADEVARPARESASRWAHRLMLPNLRQYVELDEEHSMIYIAAPHRFQHQTLKNLDLRNRHGVNLIAIERKPKPPADPTSSAQPESPGIARPLLIVPTAGTTILPDDILILVGANESLTELPAD